MAGDVGLRIEQISANLTKLIQMHTDVMRVRTRITQLRQDNAAGVWPDIDSVTEFASRYRQALDATDRELYAISEEIEACRLALAESTRSLQAQDAAVQDQLSALAHRLETTGYATARPVRAV